MTKCACVDGPEFDGHLVEFVAAMELAALYKDFEREADCNLLRQEVQH